MVVTFVLPVGGTMYESFLEIAFEAELDTSESPELLVAAKELCNENPLTRDSAIVELRQMIFGKLIYFLT